MASNIDFLRPFVFDPAILEWNPGSSASDLTKKVHDIFKIMKEDPASLRSAMVKDVVYDKDSQIGAKEDRLGHYQRTATINKQLTQLLQEKYPSLDLLTPNIAYASGLIHDLSAAYARYDGVFTQEDKELTLYFHAKHLGVDLISNHVAMHATYWEILEMITYGDGFEKIDLYQDWTDVFNNVGPFNLWRLYNNFRLFLDGKENFPLMVLTIADYLDIGTGKLDSENLHHSFGERAVEIIECHYTRRIVDGKFPTAFGESMVHGGLERITEYLHTIDDLVHDKNIDYHRRTKPGLWRT